MTQKYEVHIVDVEYDAQHNPPDLSEPSGRCLIVHYNVRPPNLLWMAHYLVIPWNIEDDNVETLKMAIGEALQKEIRELREEHKKEKHLAGFAGLTFEVEVNDE